MSNAITEVSNISLKIVQHGDAENPREWDNLGTMVCSHSRYNLGDEDGQEKAKALVRSHFSDHILDEYDLHNPAEVLLLLLRSNLVIFLPLYLYDHSGITMRTTPF